MTRPFSAVSLIWLLLIDQSMAVSVAGFAPVAETAFKKFQDMKSGTFICLLFLAVVFCSCSQKQKIATEKDYVHLLDGKYFNKQDSRLKKETAFWADRLNKDTASYVNLMELGRCYLAEFKLNADVNRLLAGDSLIKAASARLNHTEPEILFALSQNSITRHQFKEAALRNSDATHAGGNLYTICLLGFDVNMELGNYDLALKQLEQLKDKKSFDYLIRRAKWEDHTGNLDKAIALMEEAAQKTRNSRVAASWVQSNLGDMYGHAGEVKKSYQSYLSVLENEPANFHCLQGIAWIAFAQDGDVDAARKIISFILRYYPEPGLYLQLAEIAASEGKSGEQKMYENKFLDLVKNDRYGNMYNQYKIDILASQPEAGDAALRLAGQELKNRFTPETADRYALALLSTGQVEKAYQFAKAYVYRRCFEPLVLLHTARIFIAAGHQDEARELLLSCQESTFELGPVKMKTVNKLLSSLP